MNALNNKKHDCANTLCNPVMPELVHNETRLLTNAAILADALALDLSRYLRLPTPTPVKMQVGGCCAMV
jgi:streptomycin 6-kinase